MTPYDAANSYLQDNLEAVCSYLFPDGRREGKNFTIGNIAGLPGHSFVVALEPADKRGLYKDFAGGNGSRNLCQLWKEVRGIPKDNHSRFFQELEAYAGRSFGWNGAASGKKANWEDWDHWHGEFNKADGIRLATHPKRQYKVETVQWLHANKHLGLYRGNISFAMFDEAGSVVGVHRWIESEGILKFLGSPTLLVIGDPATATECDIHESTWDLIAELDRTGWHLDPTKLFLCTRGAGSGRLIKDRIPANISKIYVWTQNEEPDPNTGKKPNEEWQATVAKAAGRPVHIVRIPETYKDLNEWTIAGVSADEIGFARGLATLYQGPTRGAGPPKTSFSTLPTEFPPAEDRPCYRVYDSPITINQHEYKAGVYHHDVETFNDRKYPIDIWISAPLLVTAKTATARNRNYGRLLEFTSSNAVNRKWSMPMELLAGDGTPILARLLDDGLEISHPARKKLLDYIASAEPAEFLRCTTATGWHSSLRIFVLLEEIIAHPDTTPKEKVWFQSAGKNADYAKAGSLQAWQSNVAALAKGNNYLLFAISFGLVGPLLDPLGLRGIGVNVFGDSTTGKTTAAEVSASLWGHGHDYSMTWNTTANALESVCAEHSDTLLVLDEIAEIDPRDLDKAAYACLNGQGKRRSDRSGNAKAVHLWRAALLSTGEKSVQARLAEAGIIIKVGQELRLIDLPVNGEKSGLFDTLHGRSDAKAFSDELRAAASTDYGHAGPAFVNTLFTYSIERLRQLHRGILNLFKTDHPQQRRVAEAFAAVALAGELAARAGILPWNVATSTDYSDSDSATAAVSLFNRWKANRDHQSKFASEHDKILAVINSFIEEHGYGWFMDINAAPSATATGYPIPIPTVQKLSGYWDDSSGSRIYLFTGKGLQEATKGYDFKRVLEALDQAGAFAKKDAGQKSVNTRTPDNKQTRLYYIDPAKLT